MSAFPTPSMLRSLAWLAFPLALATAAVVSRHYDRDYTEVFRNAEGSRSDLSATDQSMTSLKRRIRLKEYIADATLEGHRTLFEAAAMFRALDRMEPSMALDSLRDRFPAATEEECYCLQVIAWVEGPMEREASQVAGGLRIELEAALLVGPITLSENPLLFVALQE